MRPEHSETKAKPRPESARPRTRPKSCYKTRSETMRPRLRPV